MNSVHSRLFDDAVLINPHDHYCAEVSNNLQSVVKELRNPKSRLFLVEWYQMKGLQSISPFCVSDRRRQQENKSQACSNLAQHYKHNTSPTHPAPVLKNKICVCTYRALHCQILNMRGEQLSTPVQMWYRNI